MPRRTLLLIDDHTLFREGLAWLVREHFPGVVIHAVAGTEELAPGEPGPGPRDLVVLGLSAQGEQAVQPVASCRSRWPDTPLLALLDPDAAALLAPLRAAGCDGVIVRTAQPQGVLDLLQRLWARRRRFVDSGHLPMAGTLRAATALQPHEQGVRPPVAARPIVCAPNVRQDDLLGFGLSPRQVDVLRLVAGGHTNKQISRALGLAESTVKTHVLGLFQKLGLGSRAEVVVWAGSQGLPAAALDRTVAPGDPAGGLRC